MKDQAIEKIKAEMEANKTNGGMLAAGEMLIQYLRQHPEAAESILAEGVTLKKAYQALYDEARRRAGGASSCWISDAEGFGIILEYFGIKPAGDGNGAPNGTFDVRLEDLMEI